MHCANCASPALYVYDPKPLKATAYCEKHLPSFLREAAKQGTLPTTEAYSDRRASALAKLAPEEPAQEPSAEEPKPRKRTRKASEEPAEEQTEAEPSQEAPEPVEAPEEPAEA